MDYIANLERVSELYRAYVHMMHGTDPFEEVKSSIANLQDGELLQIIPGGAENAKKDDRRTVQPD